MLKAESDSTRIGIIGLGNVLMSDDAFGPYLIHALGAGYAFPTQVELLDLGTPSLALIAHIEDFDALIILDTVRAEGPAGTLHTYRRDEILSQPIEPRTDAHEPALKEALLIAEFHGRGPRQLFLIGVTPETTAMGTGLSAAVRGSVPRAVEEVLRELTRLGVVVTARREARQTQVWWEGQAEISPLEALF